MNRPTIATVTARDFSPDSEWTLTFPGPDAIPYVPRTFSATGPLIGQFEVPVQAGETFEWTIDQAGTPEFIAYGDSVPTRFGEDPFVTAPVGTQYTGELPPGTRFVNWVFWGDHTFSLG